SSQPAAQTIDPGQTVVYTLSLKLSSARTWTASTIMLWDDDHGTAYKALPANGQNQQFNFTLVLNCTQRPPVDVKAVASGDGRLAVPISGGPTGDGKPPAQFALHCRWSHPQHERADRRAGCRQRRAGKHLRALDQQPHLVHVLRAASGARTAGDGARRGDRRLRRLADDRWGRGRCAVLSTYRTLAE